MARILQARKQHSGEGEKWTGWSEFSIVAVKNDRASSKYHKKAHYMTKWNDLSMEATERARVNEEIENVKSIMVFHAPLYHTKRKKGKVEFEIPRSSPFHDGYPGTRNRTCLMRANRLPRG